MKTLTFLAILILATPAFARDRHRGHSHSHNRHHHHHRAGGFSGLSLSYGNRHYHTYRSGYYRSYPYRTYPYRNYSSYYYQPAVSVSYASSPRYYSDYAPAYRDSYYDDESIEAQVQLELRRRGHYRGAVDGDIGPASRSAIRSWQYRQGLATTGRIDRALLRSLGI